MNSAVAAGRERRGTLEEKGSRAGVSCSQEVPRAGVSGAHRAQGRSGTSEVSGLTRSEMTTGDGPAVDSGL